MRFGGFMQYSKFKAIEGIASNYLPKMKHYSSTQVDAQFYKKDFDFPFIVKPDIGERGKAVELIRNAEQFKEWFAENQEDFMIQEYVKEGIELGVLYYRFPSGQSGITSVVSKGFLEIVGDGYSSIQTLIESELRAASRLDHFLDKFADRLEIIPAHGERLLLEEIGNHSRGTEFRNANHLINSKLVKVFDQIVEPLEGFHYGRFDLKVNSIDDLYAGKNISIFELNGVNSEAAHIYDPALNIWQAYRDVYHNLQLVFKIGQENQKNGCEATSISEFFKALTKQLNYRKDPKLVNTTH